MLIENQKTGELVATLQLLSPGTSLREGIAYQNDAMWIKTNN